VSTITHRSSHRPTPVIAAGRTRYGYRVDPNSAHPRAGGDTPHQPLASESRPDEPQPAPGQRQSDATADGAPRPLPLTGTPPTPPRTRCRPLLLPGRGKSLPPLPIFISSAYLRPHNVRSSALASLKLEGGAAHREAGRLDLMV
jgi:hypothetical protein